MKKLLLLVVLSFVLFATNLVIAQDSKKKGDTTTTTTTTTTKTPVKKTEPDTLAKGSGNAPAAANADSLAKNQRAPTEAEVRSKFTIDMIIIFSFLGIMILLLIMFFVHLGKPNRQRIGFQSIKLIGLTLIFPGICILAIVGGDRVLSGQTLAVLLGTIAGYVLSKDDGDNDRLEIELKKKITELENKLKKIKEEHPHIEI